MTSTVHNYHDTTLINIGIEWEKGITTIVFKLSIKPEQMAKLIVKETASLQCPRKFPWGKSISVNSLTITNAEPNEYRIEIEMQSGDQIIIIGKEIVEA